MNKGASDGQSDLPPGALPILVDGAWCHYFPPARPYCRGCGRGPIEHFHTVDGNGWRPTVALFCESCVEVLRGRPTPVEPVHPETPPVPPLFRGLIEPDAEQRLAKKRNRYSVSQASLAFAVQYSPGRISDLERGIRPSRENELTFLLNAIDTLVAERLQFDAEIARKRFDSRTLEVSEEPTIAKACFFC